MQMARVPYVNDGPWQDFNITLYRRPRKSAATQSPEIALCFEGSRLV